MIDNFYPSLSVAISFIGGCLAAGWALSREVNDIKEKYRDDVNSFKALTKAHFASDLLLLHGFMKKARVGGKVTTKDLMDQAYVDKVTALSEFIESEKDAADYYASMWRACSSGSRYMFGSGLLLAPIPVLLFVYTPDISGALTGIGFLLVTFAIGLAYSGGLRLLSYLRNRERLLKLLEEEPLRQAKLPEFESE